MDKPKKWHLILIFAVFALAAYNVLPTVFYYAKNLKQPVGEAHARAAAGEIAGRLRSLSDERLEWLASYSKHLQAPPLSISPDPAYPELIHIDYAQAEEATRVRTHLLRAAFLVPHASMRLIPLPETDPARITVLAPSSPVREADFSFVPVAEADGTLAAPYREWAIDRAAAIGSAAGGPAEYALFLKTFARLPSADVPQDALLAFAESVNELQTLFKHRPSLLASLSARLTAGLGQDRPFILSALSSSIDLLRDRIKQEKGKLPEGSDAAAFERHETSLALAQAFLKKHRAALLAESTPLSPDEARSRLATTGSLSFGACNPLFQNLSIDWEEGSLSLRLSPEFLACREEASKEHRERLERFLINEAARIARLSDERLSPEADAFSLKLHGAGRPSGLLVLNLEDAANRQMDLAAHLIRTFWSPQHPDLSPENCPIATDLSSLSEMDKQLCLLVSPRSDPSEGGRDSLFVIAKGLGSLIQQTSLSGQANAAALLQEDLSALVDLLQRCGFALSSSADPRDIVFEKSRASDSLLAATREEFRAAGSRRQAVLELTTLEQRLLVQNRIDTSLHEELAKWRDDYRISQINPSSPARFDVPPPTKSVFRNNLRLSLVKYFRGDERKIIRWGLDLSGGKTVHIELRDTNGRPVVSEADLRQGMNELFKRVNKRGVSEASLRLVGTHIVLDIPACEGTKASELLDSSTMYFHVVNEQFSSGSLRLAAEKFLQDVWNEASLLNRQDAKSINQIACRHLDGASSEAARLLYDQGLRLEQQSDSSGAFDLAFSKIAVLREPQSRSHPLLIVFANYALEGAHLANIRSSYDPTHGNYLSFDVKPPCRDAFHTWTSHFSKDRWRMAVVLNDTVINAPTLNAALRDSAMISGSFTQREVSQLAADLKTGSLTFSPHILSEQQVSPELGASDRIKGISATFAAFAIVIVSMVAYYRFSGLVASAAVLLNLLIMWATLQNLQATLSLAGIAGIILTVGMAIDANVLVFERIREEFPLHGKLGRAIRSGYQKAFSAILDSNLTTIIAALVLLNFDAGPVKGFAITLMIGIASSMFTALFLTRTFFAHWVQRQNDRPLNMARWIRPSSFDFLKRSAWAIALSGCLLIGGAFLGIAHRSTFFGMDFTGGFSTQIALQPPENGGSPAHLAENALLAEGLHPGDFQIRALSSDTQLRISLSTPAQEQAAQHGRHALDWMLDALDRHGLAMTEENRAAAAGNWSSISGQMSDSMRNNAMLGLAIAFALTFIYLAVRFEAVYATSAIVCLLHDVLATLGIMAVLHALGLPLQLDLNTLAAMLTIVGYSLNDTIIIFDRIREELRDREDSVSLYELINHALNATLSRTSITSGTTLLVLIALVSLGGSSLFGFSLVMTAGVVIGTLSSWFIATPCLYFLMRRRQA